MYTFSFMMKIGKIVFKRINNIMLSYTI